MEPGAFWGIASFLGASLVTIFIFFVQQRLAKRTMVRQMRATARLLTRATGREVYLNGIPDAEDPELRVLAAKGLAAMRKHKWDRAVGLFSKALGHAGGTKESAALHNLIGTCHYVPGEWGRALASFSESARLAVEFGDKTGAAHALGSIGALHLDMGKLDDALDCLGASLNVFRELRDRHGEANCLSSIGLVLYAKGELGEALKFHEEALGMYREVGDRRGEASELGNFGVVYMAEGELSKALERSEQALAHNSGDIIIPGT